MKASAIRHLATSRSGEIFAAAEFESVVSIWNLETETKQTEFQTVLDFGGDRLAIDKEGKRCVTAAYHVHGIACYSAQTGEVLWQRKDLKKAQRICVLPSQSEIACGFENGPLQVLSMHDGKTLQKIRGCRRLWISPFEPIQLADRARLELQTLDASTIAKIDRESFATLSVAFGHGAVAVSEAAGPLRCVETGSGQLLWRYQGPAGSHSLTVGYHSELRRFLAIEWPYEKGGIKSLLLFGIKNGEVEARFPLGSSIIETFCLGGTHLLSSSGWLLDTTTGRLAKQFEFPMKEYPDS
jgi:outer membrane protein assembly factor BamB